MKPNTNDEHEFDKRDRKIDADFNQAIGYAKALNDVEKIIDKINKKYRSCLAVTDMDDFDCDIVIGFNKELKQSLAKLEKK